MISLILFLKEICEGWLLKYKTSLIVLPFLKNESFEKKEQKSSQSMTKIIFSPDFNMFNDMSGLINISGLLSS